MYTVIARFWQLILRPFEVFALKVKEEKSNLSNLESKPIIELSQEDFAIVFRNSKIEAIMPADDSEGEEMSESRVHIENTISYIMHCLLREDWQDEFFDAVEDYLENASEIEAEQRRSQFKLITNDSIDCEENHEDS